MSNVALWIDVEGAAGIVIEGLTNSFLERKVSSVYIEVEERESWKGQRVESDVISMLLELNYIPILSDDEYAGQHNLIFVRHEDATERFMNYLLAAYDKVARSLI